MINKLNMQAGLSNLQLHLSPLSKSLGIFFSSPPRDHNNSFCVLPLFVFFSVAAHHEAKLQGSWVENNSFKKELVVIFLSTPLYFFSMSS